MGRKGGAATGRQEENKEECSFRIGEGTFREAQSVRGLECGRVVLSLGFVGMLLRSELTEEGLSKR